MKQQFLSDGLNQGLLALLGEVLTSGSKIKMCNSHPFQVSTLQFQLWTYYKGNQWKLPLIRLNALIGQIVNLAEQLANRRFKLNNFFEKTETGKDFSFEQLFQSYTHNIIWVT